MQTKIKYISIFAIAMALLEAAVVIYLRELYYPDGFTVAMKLIKESIIMTELAREAATIVMLGSVSLLAGRNRIERFAFFLLSFAVWDIFYYIWLKIFLNWPESLFTWDILFLIPVTWLGPVLAPVICAATMILLSLLLIRINEQKACFSLRISDWTLLAGGSLLILYTFIKDYASIIIGNGWLLEIDSLMHNAQFLSITASFIPASYDWMMFGAGEVLILISILIIAARDLKPKPSFYKWI